MGGAIESLPSLRPDDGQTNIANSAIPLKTGTFDVPSVAVNVAVDAVQKGRSKSFSVQTYRNDHESAGLDGFVATPETVVVSDFPSVVDRSELRAGEGIRTPDVQLGKLAFYH